MLKFQSISSGSCGNCYYLGFDDIESGHKYGLIIDAGVSARRLKQVLSLGGLDAESLSAVLITHDHADHIRSLASFCKRIGKPVYATTVLHKALARRSFAGDNLAACRKDLVEGEWNAIGSFNVRYFYVPHDATQTVGYVIKYAGETFVIMTDIGRMTPEAEKWASLADTVVIEANYDKEMLANGPYPKDLQERISSGNGHLSNDECAAAVSRFVHLGLKNIFLCHLSEHNNTPELAVEAVTAALSAFPQYNIRLMALPRQTPSGLMLL